MPPRSVRIALGLALGCAAGCALNPVSGRPEVVLTTAEGEREIGRQEARRLEARIGFVRDPRLTDYVEAVGRRLATLSPRRDVSWVFAVVDAPEANAFALPGGYVLVTRGLLALMNSEDELANVLGHEMGHVAARHAVQRLSASVPFSIVSGVGALATGIVSPQLGEAVAGIGQVAGALALAPYGRHQEREADRVGQEMAAAAGWDPAGMASFLATLDRDQALNGTDPGHAGFLDTHPATSERILETSARALALPRATTPPIAAGRTAFLDRLDGLLVGADPAEGLFVDGRFVHPDLGFTFRLPEGWPRVNSPSYVAAVAPAEDAVVMLQHIGAADDPMEPARAVQAEAVQERMGIRFPAGAEPLVIGDLRAARAVGETRGTKLDLTWIALGAEIYQVTGVSRATTFETYRPQFSAVAQGFRPLTAAERSEIKDTRLRVVRATGHETLERVVARAGSTWSPRQAAVANGLELGQPLAAGTLVKLPIREPHRPPPRP
jgi:predicted Zn-dependent protease